MPLFNYECPECELCVEKFQHNADEIEVLCEECGEKCKQVFSPAKNRVWRDARETYDEQIKPDADRIMKNMKKRDKEFFDIYGEK